MGSEQVAAVLRQSGSDVRLIVARPVNEPSPLPTPHAVVPTHQLDEHLAQINNILHNEMGYMELSEDNLVSEQHGLGIVQVHQVYCRETKSVHLVEIISKLTWGYDWERYW